MTNETYTGQTGWRVGGVSKAYPSEVIPLSFEGRNKDVDRRSIVSRYGMKVVRSKQKNKKKIHNDSIYTISKYNDSLWRDVSGVE